MRIFIFSLLLFLLSCGSDKKTETSKSEKKETTSIETTAEVSSETTSETPSEPVDVTKLNYKKTVENSEFAVYKTTSVFEGNREYYFKTLDGISLKFKIPMEGKSDAIVPANLLDDVVFVGEPAGGNYDMVGKVFEIVYNKDNMLSEIKLAKVD